MTDIAIIGAGELGGSVAYVLARRNVATSIRLIDERGQVAEGKALDIMQSAPIERFATRLSGSTDVSAASGASVIILADAVGGSEWQGEAGLMLLKRLTALASRSVILCVGAAQRELVEHGVRQLHIGRERLFGSAPEALVSGARALVALALDGSPADVALSVLGVPPSHIVIPWEDATAAGFAVTRLVDQPTRRRLSAQAAAMWPPGPHVLASAASKVVEALLGRTRALVSCFVAPDDSSGRRTRAAALPVRLGSTGIERVVLPSLSAIDRVTLDNAMLL